MITRWNLISELQIVSILLVFLVSILPRHISMKHAFVHDRLIHIWWAEQVFFDHIEKYLTQSPGEATIFTLISRTDAVTINGQTIPIVSVFPVRFTRYLLRIQRIDTHIFYDVPVMQHLYPRCIRLIQKLTDYRNSIVIAPFLTKVLRSRIHRYRPRQIFISSFATTKNIIPVGKIVDAHVILYLHSPMQYIWQNYDEYCKKLAARQLLIFKPLTRYLRTRDTKPRRYDIIHANSVYTKQCAKETYNLDAYISYPTLEKIYTTTSPTTKPDGYYLYVGRLVKFVRETDLIIHLCNKLQIPLLVMWSWPDEEYLKSLAGDTITFIGQVDDEQEKLDIIKKSRGLINLAQESCGIATMEALALWVPVFWYNAGATPELVWADSWYLVDSKEFYSLVEDFKNFQQQSFDRTHIKQTFLATIAKYK